MNKNHIILQKEFCEVAEHAAGYTATHSEANVTLFLEK